jgi:hypothetical protein
MPMHLRFKLAGTALILGGITAGICHFFSFESSSDVSHLSQYARFAEPVHLLLFMSLIVVLLAWFEQYSLQSASTGILGFASFVCVILGIICGDLIHCILEFSVFPVLGSIVPYALPGIAGMTYHSAPVGSLILAGRCLMIIGCGAAAAAIYLKRLLPLWAAAPFALSAALFVLALRPQFAMVQPAAMPFFYFTMAVLGVSIVSAGRGKGAVA